MKKDFALCFNDDYVPCACVTIRSIAEHMNMEDDVYVHVLTDRISIKNKAILKKAALNKSKNIKIFFYSVDSDSEMFSGMPPQAMIWTVYAWYRMLLPLILNNTNKVLYLDCDVYVNDCLDELFSMDLNTSIAACLDTETYNPSTYNRLKYDSKYKYVCSGVLMMNLDRWRTLNLSRKIVDFAKKNSKAIKYPDQDAINVICRDDKIVLPPNYGVTVSYFRFKEFMKEHLFDMHELMENPKIIHFAGYQPWFYFKDKSMHSLLWWKTFRSLHSFPKVYLTYASYFVFYWIKRFLIFLGLIKPTSKYYMLGWYYNHPRIKYADVMKTLSSLYST